MEHHLFPAISFLHYPAIARVVASECAARGIPYARYASLPDAIAAFCRCAARRAAGRARLLAPASLVVKRTIPGVCWAYTAFVQARACALPHVCMRAGTAVPVAGRWAGNPGAVLQCAAGSCSHVRYVLCTAGYCGRHLGCSCCDAICAQGVP